MFPKRLLALAFVGLIAADAFTDRIPTCAVSCVPAALKEAKCATGDYTCLCGKNIHRIVTDDDVEPCLQKNCSDLAGTQKSIEDVCASFGASSSAASSSAAAVSTAIPSGTSAATATASSATASPTKTGAAGRMEVGMGAVIAAVAALAL